MDHARKRGKVEGFRDSGTRLRTIGVSVLPIRFMAPNSGPHSPHRDVSDGHAAQNRVLRSNEVSRWALSVLPISVPSHSFLQKVFNLWSTLRRWYAFIFHDEQSINSLEPRDVLVPRFIKILRGDSWRKAPEGPSRWTIPDKLNWSSPFTPSPGSLSSACGIFPAP